MQTTYPLSPAKEKELRDAIEEAQQEGTWEYILNRKGLAPPHTHKYLYTDSEIIVCAFSDICDFEGRFSPEKKENDPVESTSSESDQPQAKGLSKKLRDKIRLPVRV